MLTIYSTQSCHTHTHTHTRARARAHTHTHRVWKNLARSLQNRPDSLANMSYLLAYRQSRLFLAEVFRFLSRIADLDFTSLHFTSLHFTSLHFTSLSLQAGSPGGGWHNFGWIPGEERHSDDNPCHCHPQRPRVLDRSRKIRSRKVSTGLILKLATRKGQLLTDSDKYVTDPETVLNQP